MLGYIYSKITGKRSPRRGSQNEGDDLFFAGEDGHAKGGDGHEGRGRGDHIIGAGGGVLLIVGLGGVLGAVGDDDDAAARGGHGTGQGFPLCIIQSEFHSVHFVVIHKQHDFIGDHIIPGSPGGQRPGVIFTFGGDAAGHEGIILTNIQDARIQSGSG